MDDAGIVDLYWQRSERAIEETERKYGPYCRTIAYNILHDAEDTEECVDDTWMGAWSSMPDKRPARLSAFLGRITRNLALNQIARQNSRRRGGGELPLALEELGDCVPAAFDLEEELEAKELAEKLQRFISGLPRTQRRVFLGRYYYLLSIEELAARSGFSRSKVKSMLFRMRQKLLAYLEVSA